VSDLASPPPALLGTGWFPFILDFYWRVFALFNRLPGRPRVTSWFRTADNNRLVGGSPESQHLFALAMDIESEAPERLEFTIGEVARAVGLVAVPGRNFVHLQLFPAGALARAGVTFPR